MPEILNHQISLRKNPTQARSTESMEAILEAAIQVLTSEGVARFTTARVAERAGVSIGSLYQYFPNKASILFQLQRREWGLTITLLRGLLEDESRPPPARLRRLVHAFIQSECEEAEIRLALVAAVPLYSKSKEASEGKAVGKRMFETFMAEALPKVTEEQRALATDLFTTTLSAGGAEFSQEPRTAEEINAYSEAMADMLCAYLSILSESEFTQADE